MLDLAKHIVDQKFDRFEPDKFEDHYETALVDLINSKATANRDCKGAAPRLRTRDMSPLVPTICRRAGAFCKSPTALLKLRKRSAN
jgi:non-homologous end joining protein Ku